jgi:hypothetical protein
MHQADRLLWIKFLPYEAEQVSNRAGIQAAPSFRERSARSKAGPNSTTILPIIRAHEPRSERFNLPH